MNVPLNALNASVYYAVKALLDPAPSSERGLFDAVEIHTRPGTIVNPRPPAAVGCAFDHVPESRGCDLRRVSWCAAEGARDGRGAMTSMPAIVFSASSCGGRAITCTRDDRRRQRRARDRDGMDAVHVHMTNTSRPAGRSAGESSTADRRRVRASSRTWAAPAPRAEARASLARSARGAGHALLRAFRQPHGRCAARCVRRPRWSSRAARTESRPRGRGSAASPKSRAST